MEYDGERCYDSDDDEASDEEDANEAVMLRTTHFSNITSMGILDYFEILPMNYC